MKNPDPIARDFQTHVGAFLFPVSKGSLQVKRSTVWPPFCMNCLMRVCTLATRDGWLTTI